MRQVPIGRHSSVPSATFDKLASGLRDQRTLADVLAWGRSQSPPRSVTGIVTQDEYTHDVLIAWEDAIYLVFDTT